MLAMLPKMLKKAALSIIHYTEANDRNISFELKQMT